MLSLPAITYRPNITFTVDVKQEIKQTKLLSRTVLRVANLKSSYLYENLPVTKKAILSRRLILLAVLLCKVIHHTEINLHPNKQLLSTQQHACQSYLRYFLL